MFKSIAVFILLSIVLACSREDAGPTKSTSSVGAAVAPFVLTSKPTGALGVDALRAAVKNGDPVVAHGRLQDFNDSLATFKLVDPALPACGEAEGVTDGCETPWDFCCEPDLADHLVNVELRGKDGVPVAAVLRGTGGFDYLKHAVVVGTAEVDARGNITIVASGVFLGS